MIDKLTGTAGSKIDNTDTVSKILSARVLCENVYAIAKGEVVDIEASSGRAVINIKCNPSEILRYGNLTEIYCNKTNIASIGGHIGKTTDYVIFEYCTAWQGRSVYPVRVNGITYYKQDPTEILNGIYTVRPDGAQEQAIVLNRDRVRFNDNQKRLFGENVLDKNDAIRENQVWSTKKSEELLRRLGIQHYKNPKAKEEAESAIEDEDVGEG